MKLSEDQRKEIDKIASQGLNTDKPQAQFEDAIKKVLSAKPDIEPKRKYPNRNQRPSPTA